MTNLGICDCPAFLGGGRVQPLPLASVTPANLYNQRPGGLADLGDHEIPRHLLDLNQLLAAAEC